MSSIEFMETGKDFLLMGNEAIARGAVEAGVKVCAAYPGTPSSDIIATLSKVAKKFDIYVEWSVNEKVALEVAAAAAYAGQRSICAMKQNGLNVASDFLLNLNLIGIEGGLVLVACDDPSGHSSTNEQDSRHYAKIADLPLLEPATFQEAKDMTQYAFELSEEIKNVCIVRSVTRVSHARGNVSFGEIKDNYKKPYFDRNKQRITFPIEKKHNELHEKLQYLEKKHENSPFNKYSGPQAPDLLIVTSGASWLYVMEAVEILGLNTIGVLKIGTTWPLPVSLIVENLAKSKNILIVEEVDSFLEGNIKEIASEFSSQIGTKSFFGKRSKHIPYTGETTTDKVIKAITLIVGEKYEHRDKKYDEEAQKAKNILPIRSLAFCPGCPHRASYWNIKNALQLDNREGFVTGDIGCYHLARTPAGWNLLKTSGGMGTGTGLANAFGKLSRFKFTQPAISVCGDSTFFHAAMPALVDAVYNKINMIMVILDNSATAMTGFQPHPGLEVNAMNEETQPINIESVCKAFGAKVEISDPFDLGKTQNLLLKMLEDEEGTKVLIMKRPCALLKNKTKRFRVNIDPEKCIGEECGCNRLCTRNFKCPGLIWNNENRKAEIDSAICVGCGACEKICPEGAILKEDQHGK